MRIKLALFLSFWFIIIQNSSGQYLSREGKVSLITIGSGDDLYSSFGHSAFWVYDPTTGMDRIYNYGTFDFNQPGFYVKFTRGKLLYQLSVSNMERLMGGAQYENRSVIEQELNLSFRQKRELFAFLEKNYLPENRSYRYDFFFDNCSSRLRDGIKVTCGDSVEFTLKKTDNKSFRQLLDPYLLNKQWQDLGMDTGLGTPADRKATSYDYMFLPEHLMDGFDHAILKSGVETRPLVKSKRVLYEGQNFSAGETSFFTPVLFFWILFFLILILTWYQIKKAQYSNLIDIILLTFTGLLGFLIVFLWFGTDHKVTANNWNLIWAMPFNFIFVFILIKRNSLNFIGKYFLIYGILLSILLISWNYIPQEINIATFPFILTLAFRSFFNYYKFSKS